MSNIRIVKSRGAKSLPGLARLAARRLAGGTARTYRTPESQYKRIVKRAMKARS